jgi:hypothetical protein
MDGSVGRRARRWCEVANARTELALFDTRATRVTPYSHTETTRTTILFI